MKERILVTGVSASGKSHLARQLAYELNVPYVESDDAGQRVNDRWLYDERRIVSTLIRLQTYILAFPSDCIYDDFPWELFNQIILVKATPTEILARKIKRQHLEPQNSWITIPTIQEIGSAQRRACSDVRRMCKNKEIILTIKQTSGCGPSGRGEKDVPLDLDLDSILKI